MNIKEITDQIKKGDEKLLKSIYQSHRGRFINWVCWQYDATEDDAKDAYQKSFSSFYFNVCNDKIKNKEINVETYLFAIGKNVIKKSLKKEYQKELTHVFNKELIGDDDIYKKENQAHLQQKVQTILDKVGEPCKTILKQFYFLNYSLEAIAIRHGYKNEKIAKKKKFLCIQKIKQIINQQPK